MWCELSACHDLQSIYTGAVNTRALRAYWLVILLCGPALATADAAATAAEHARSLSLAPCRFAELARPARCGVLDVAENPAKPQGRRLSISVVVVPAPTTPALAEAAARSEVDRLSRELALKQAQLDARRTEPAVNSAAAEPGLAPSKQQLLALASGALFLGLAGGFWLGYATLARRVRRKFGGIRVY